MSITNSNFNQRSILGLHRNKVFTSPDTVSNSQLTVPFLQQNLGNVVTSNDESFNYNPSTQTLSVPNISGTVVGGSTSIAITETIDDTYYYVTFVDSSGSEKILRANTSGISYNPDKDELNVSTIIGTGNCDFLTFTGNGSNLTEVNAKTSDITDAGDDTDYYIVFTDASGSGKTLRVNETSSPGDTFTYNPSTNKLSVLRVYCGFIEADNYINVKTSELNGLIENLQLRNSIITIGTTGINLGNTKTEIVGLTKLAIGTSSPTTILDVRSTDSYTQGLFQNNNATNPGHIIIRNESYNEQIQIRSRYDGEDNHIFTWNGSAMANLRLNTSMMLLGNGNVGIGIGIISPIAPLQVGPYFTFSGTSPNYMGAIGFNRSVSTGAILNPTYQAFQIHNNNGSLYFQNYDTNGTSIDSNLLVLSNGKIGIGNSSPSAKLHISNTSTCITFIESTSNAAYMLSLIHI